MPTPELGERMDVTREGTYGKHQDNMPPPEAIEAIEVSEPIQSKEHRDEEGLPGESLQPLEPSGRLSW